MRPAPNSSPLSSNIEPARKSEYAQIVNSSNTYPRARGQPLAAKLCRRPPRLGERASDHRTHRGVIRAATQLRGPEPRSIQKPWSPLQSRSKTCLIRADVGPLARLESNERSVASSLCPNRLPTWPRKLNYRASRTARRCKDVAALVKAQGGAEPFLRRLVSYLQKHPFDED